MTATLEGRRQLGCGPLTERFDEALLFASRHHREQLRKGSHVPYMTHLMSVSALVMEHGGSEDQAIAALLHDAVEDAPAGTGGAVLAEVRSRFGDAVADIVRACSDGLDAAADATLAEHAAAFLAAGGEPVSLSAMSRAIAGLPPAPEQARTPGGRRRRAGRPLKQKA